MNVMLEGYILGLQECSPKATILPQIVFFDALGLQMTTLADVAEQLKAARVAAQMSQSELARRAGVARTTLTRMETLAKGDMSVSALTRLLEAAGYDLKFVKVRYRRTLEDILAEQRSDEDAP